MVEKRRSELVLGPWFLSRPYRTDHPTDKVVASQEDQWLVGNPPGEAINDATTDLRRFGYPPGAVSMTCRDKQNWLRMWRNDQIDFHQRSVNPLLVRFWGSLAPNRPSRIFVPLCGKSLDLLWLAEQGHEVVGVELSPVAVKAFFDENGLVPRVCRRKNYRVWEYGRLKILCGDFFSLEQMDLGPIDVVYDRAALTALPEQVRKRYVAHMRVIVPVDCRIFLLTIEDGCDESEIPLLSGAYEAVDDEIKALYAPYFEIQIAHTEAALESDPANPSSPAIAVSHKVYRLRPRT